MEERDGVGVEGGEPFVSIIMAIEGGGGGVLTNLLYHLGDYVGPLKWISPQYRTGGYYTDYRRKHGNESELGGGGCG